MTSGELHLCDYQYNYSGSFFRSLLDAFFNADETNIARLALGFPEEALAVRRYQNEDGYWDRLREEYFSKEKVPE